jgi:RND family efflux transporter MFP subunit
MVGLLRKKSVWGALLLAVALGSTLWVFYQARRAKGLVDPASARRDGNPIPVRTAQVSQAKVEQVIGGTATTVPSETALIQLNAGGSANPPGLMVKAVHVREGTFVQRGKVLFDLEDQQFRNNVQQRAAGVTAAEAELARAKEAAVEKAKVRKLSLAAAEAELARAREAATEKAKVRKLTLAAADAELTRAREAATEKAKVRKLTLAAAEAELTRAKEAATEKAKVRKLTLAAAEAELTRAKEAAVERSKVRELGLTAAKAELTRATEAATERAKVRKLTLAAAEAELTRAKEGGTEKAKLRKLALAAAEAELTRAKEAAAMRARVRKLTLAAAEADLEFRRNDLKSRDDYRKEAEALYKKKDSHPRVTKDYFEALSKYHKARAESVRAERELQQAKNEMIVGPLTDQDVLARAERALQQAAGDTVIGPLTDQDAVAKAERGLQLAKTEIVLGPLTDQDAVAKAERGLQLAKTEMALGPLTDQDVVAKAERGLQLARTEAALGPLTDQDVVAKAERSLQQAKTEMIVGPLVDQDAVAKAERGLQLARTDMVVGPLSDQEAVAKGVTALEAAQGHLNVARKELAECQVKAPLDGYVDAFTLVLGTIVRAHTPLAHVLSVDPILVKMDFPQERLGEVHLGQDAEVVLDSFPGETFKGSVARVGAQVSSQLRVLPVYIKVDNAGHRLRPGVTGYARIRHLKLALVVPATAVIAEGGKAMVFRVEAGRARIREVRTGPPVETGMVELRSGLAPGDEVVIYSNFYGSSGSLTRTEAFLQDNDRVDVNWRKWARRDD